MITCRSNFLNNDHILPEYIRVECGSLEAAATARFQVLGMDLRFLPDGVEIGGQQLKYPFSIQEIGISRWCDN